jgi:hypothetical protein
MRNIFVTLSTILIILLGFLVHSASAQVPQYTFQSILTNDTIRIGDQVEFKIIASVPKGYSVLFPNFADTLAMGVELIKALPIDTQKFGDERVELIYRLLLTSFDSGLHRIPPFELPFGENQITDTARTASLWLTVFTLPRDTTIAGIYDIKPPLAEPITLGEVAKWGGLLLLFAGLLTLIIFYFIRKKSNKPIVFFEKQEDPPHVIALRKLQKVTDDKMWETDNHKYYHSVVTEIIREYIERRFEVPALEQTTLEILQNLKSKNIIAKELYENLYDNLSLSDLVKFAKYIPTINDNEALLKFAFRFVNETKPVTVDNEQKEKTVTMNTENVDISEVSSNSQKLN